MDTPEAQPQAQPPPDAEIEQRLALARDALVRFRGQCFWSWPREVKVTPELLPNIAAALRLHGGREGFLIGAKLCPSPQSRKRFFDFSANTGTPTAT